MNEPAIKRSQLMYGRKRARCEAHRLHTSRKPQQPSHNCTIRTAPSCSSTACPLLGIAVLSPFQSARALFPCRRSRSRCLRRQPRKMEWAIGRKLLHSRVAGKAEVVFEGGVRSWGPVRHGQRRRWDSEWIPIIDEPWPIPAVLQR